MDTVRQSIPERGAKAPPPTKEAAPSGTNVPSSTGSKQPVAEPVAKGMPVPSVKGMPPVTPQNASSANAAPEAASASVTADAVSAYQKARSRLQAKYSGDLDGVKSKPTASSGTAYTKVSRDAATSVTAGQQDPQPNSSSTVMQTSRKLGIAKPPLPIISNSKHDLQSLHAGKAGSPRATMDRQQLSSPAHSSNKSPSKLSTASDGIQQASPLSADIARIRAAFRAKTSAAVEEFEHGLTPVSSQAKAPSAGSTSARQPFAMSPSARQAAASESPLSAQAQHDTETPTSRQAQPGTDCPPNADDGERSSAGEVATGTTDARKSAASQSLRELKQKIAAASARRKGKSGTQVSAHRCLAL